MQALNTFRGRSTRRGYGMLALLALIAALLAIAVVIRANDTTESSAPRSVAQNTRVNGSSRSGETLQSKQVVRAVSPQPKATAKLAPNSRIGFIGALPGEMRPHSGIPHGMGFTESDTQVPRGVTESHVAVCGHTSSNRICIEP